MSETILVCGHKNPDNDSICSAVAAANMHNIIAERERDRYSEEDFPVYKAVRLGPLPPESAWVLAQQGIEPPELIERIEPGQKIVLVDHNEPQQAVDGIEEADIVEVVDHHRVAGLTTANPVKMVFMTWGCTATILTKMYEAYRVPITQHMATIMLSAILTDTVITKSPTTTDTDREVIQQLAHIAMVDATEFGLKLFKQRGGEETMDIAKLVCADSKEFPVAGKTVLIAQRETVDLPCVMAREDEMRSYMRDVFVDNPTNEEIPASVGMTPEKVKEMYRLLSIAKYDDRFVIPTAHPEMPRGIKELEGCPVSYDVEAFHGLAPATSNRPMGGSSPEGRQMLPLEVVR